MKYYEFSKSERIKVKNSIYINIFKDVKSNSFENTLKYSSDNDTYIRKNAYLAIGEIYINNADLRTRILKFLKNYINHNNEKMRQTIVYSLVNIGIIDFNKITELLEKSMYDAHHSVRNAVIGALKQLGQKNPVQTISFTMKYLHHEDFKVRREIIHGLELRGRTHPEEILPLLQEVQNDKNRIVKKMIIHVLGQMSYKKGCLEKVISNLKNWSNKELVQMALLEIIQVHHNYEKFSYYSPKQAEEYIKNKFKILNNLY